MSADTLIALVRGGWIVLACLMLLSRLVFTVVGAVRMRAFLDAWQTGGTRRIWGAASLAFAAVLAAGALAVEGDLRALDWILLGALLAVLVADGLVNVLPAGFREFKDRLQAAWVARTRGSGREGDSHLFGTVNALLALGSAGVLVLVLAYRPFEPWAVAATVALSLVLLAGLVGPTLRATR